MVARTWSAATPSWRRWTCSSSRLRRYRRRLSSRARPGSGRPRSCAARWRGRRRPGSASSTRARAEGEAELPYVGLADLLAPVGAAVIARLARPQREALAAAVAREGSSAAVDEHALSRGLLELLRLEAAAGDLLVVIDDVQWLDRPTARALGFALRRAGALPLRVLVAARSEGAAPMAAVRTRTVGARRRRRPPRPVGDGARRVDQATDRRAAAAAAAQGARAYLRREPDVRGRARALFGRRSFATDDPHAGAAGAHRGARPAGARRSESCRIRAPAFTCLAPQCRRPPAWTRDGAYGRNPPAPGRAAGVHAPAARLRGV